MSSTFSKRLFLSFLTFGLCHAAPDASAQAPAQPAAPIPGSIGCLVMNSGLDPASAATAGQLVCDELRMQGVALSAPGSNTEKAYRVSFARLGNSLVVHVSYEAPVGAVVRTRRMVLSQPEQVTFAAPRIARAVVNDEPLESTQRVDNLVGEETRKYEKKSGEFLWGLGITGTSAPTESVWMSPGIDFMGYYETPDYAFGFSLRSSFGAGDKKLTFASAGVGGRYFFSDADVSAFVGAGLAVSGMELSEDYDYGDMSTPHAEGGGLGAFGEVGVELMRLHSSRMILGLRADAPFYSVEEDAWDPTSEAHEARWVMPLTISATYAW